MDDGPTAVSPAIVCTAGGAGGVGEWMETLRGVFTSLAQTIGGRIRVGIGITEAGGLGRDRAIGQSLDTMAIRERIERECSSELEAQG